MCWSHGLHYIAHGHQEKRHPSDLLYRVRCRRERHHPIDLADVTTQSHRSCCPYSTPSSCSQMRCPFWSVLVLAMAEVMEETVRW